MKLDFNWLFFIKRLLLALLKWVLMSRHTGYFDRCVRLVLLVFSRCRFALQKRISQSSKQSDKERGAKRSRQQQQKKKKPMSQFMALLRQHAPATMKPPPPPPSVCATCAIHAASCKLQALSCQRCPAACFYWSACDFFLLCCSGKSL